MKKLLYASLVLIAILSLMLGVGLYAYAEESPEPVWRVTHADGTSEDIYSFTEPLLSARSGDRFKLIPAYYEIKLDTTFIATAYTDYTLDFGSSAVVLTSTENHSPAINFSGDTELTILGDGCSVYLQDQTSAFMSFGGESKLYLDGGKNMFRVFAPDAFEINGSSSAEVHNLYVYKHCANMMGGFCVRNTAKATVYDSIFVSEKNRNAVFTDVEGQLTLVNCSVLSRDNSQVMAVRGKKAAITLEGECFVYGNIGYLNTTEQDAYVFLDGRLYTSSVTFNKRFSDKELATVNKGASYTIPNITINPDTGLIGPSEVSFDKASFIFTKRFGAEDAPSMDIPADSRVWELTDREGEQLGYLDSFAGLALFSESIGRARLLKSVDAFTPLSMSVNGDIAIDLNGKDIFFYSHPFIHTDSSSIFSFLGEGNLELCAFASVIAAEEGYSLATANGWVSLNLNMPETIIVTSTLASSLRGDIAVNSLSAFGSEGAMLSSVSGNITVTSSTLRSGGAVATTNGSILVKDSILISTDGEVISTAKDLSFEECPAIIGGIIAPGVSCSVGTKLTERLSNGFGFFHVAKPSSISVVEYAVADGEVVSLGAVDYSTSLETVTTEGYLSASLTLGTYPLLNVYVPMMIAEENEDFALRITARGVLYNGGIDNCTEVTVDGEEYMRFSYPYIYSNAFDEEVTVSLVVGNSSETKTAVPYKLALDSLELTTDRAIISSVVAYLSYALFTCYDETLSALLEEYSEYLPAHPEYTPSGRISSILSSISLDTESNLLYLNLKDISASLTVNYTYGGRRYTAEAVEGRVAIHWHRLDIKSIELASGNESFTAGLAEMYSLVCQSPSRSGETLGRYIAFINSISD